MRRHNIGALAMATTGPYVIVGFTIYFNNPGLNKAWPIQQKDKGMVVLGVHSPEFTFEKNYANVKARSPKIWDNLSCNSSYKGRKSYHNYYQTQ